MTEANDTLRQKVLDMCRPSYEAALVELAEPGNNSQTLVCLCTLYETVLDFHQAEAPRPLEPGEIVAHYAELHRQAKANMLGWLSQRIREIIEDLSAAESEVSILRADLRNATARYDQTHRDFMEAIAQRDAAGEIIRQVYESRFSGAIEANTNANKIMAEYLLLISPRPAPESHDGFAEPEKIPGKHRFMAGSCVDCGKPLADTCIPFADPESKPDWALGVSEGQCADTGTTLSKSTGESTP